MSHRSTPLHATAVLMIAVLLGPTAALLPIDPASGARRGAAPTVTAPMVTAQMVTAPMVTAHADRMSSVDTTVTLITGDRVRVTGGRISVEPAAGRERIGFTRYTSHGDTYVVPVDAVPLTASGRVDRRLFNITGLVRYGLDDRSRPDLPLIVTRTAGSAATARSLSSTLPGAVLTRNLPRTRASAVRAARATTGRLWASVSGGTRGPRASAATRNALAGGVDRILLDGPVHATLDRSVPQIGAPAAWQAGYTGQGVTVAVVDSGVDVTHPDLADAVIGAADFTGSASGTDDRYGHGTHVASIVTGSGVAHAAGYKGVAPDAKLLNAKVLDDAGAGSESTIIAGLQWAVDHGARVVNVSLGRDFSADGTDLMSAEVDRLTAQTGVLFVVAAGNNGPAAGTIGSPAAAESALTVGAVGIDGALAPFSARGPRYLDDGVKPDITAPGVGIVAALAGAGDTLGPYIARSGTSMAAPHVAGAAAILAGQHPGWTAAQLKAVLMGAAVPTAGKTVYEQGAGRVDVARAVNQPVRSSTANLSAGVVAWPHTDDAPIAKRVTYLNSGPSPVTLDLALDVRDPAGEPAPAGMFTVDQQQLTVPSGGQAVATVRTDTRVAAPPGVYGGALTATGPDGIGVRIPVGVDVEPERYTVTVTVRDRDGAATGQYGFRFIDLDTLAEYAPYVPSGTVVVRLPKGRYRFDSLVRTPLTTSDVPDATDLVIGVEPEVVVDHDQALTVDGRDGKPVAMRVERPEARIGSASIDFDSTAGPDTVAGYSYIGAGQGFRDVYVRPSTTRAPGRFRFTAEAGLARPSADEGFRDSPYLYNLRVVEDGRVPDGLDRTFADSDLATVHTTMAGAAEGRTGVRGIVEVALPGTLTEYYTPGQPWYPDFSQWNAAHRREHVLWSLVRIYHRGQVATARWNTAAFGPSVPTSPGRTYIAERVGDQLAFGIAMFADGGVNNSGFTGTATAEKTVLSRGDTVIGEWPTAGRGYFTVPAEPAMYRLHSEYSQSGSATSTRVGADWTFASARGTGNDVADLPLLAVRFTPVLDDRNRAPAGGPFSFDVVVQRNGAGLVREGVDLTVEASYDEGTSWQPATVSVNADGWTATLDHPAAGSVSLRATATDASGSSVRETIVRAYSLR